MCGVERCPRSRHQSDLRGEREGGDHGRLRVNARKTVINVTETSTGERKSELKALVWPKGEMIT